MGIELKALGDLGFKRVEKRIPSAVEILAESREAEAG